MNVFIEYIHSQYGHIGEERVQSKKTLFENHCSSSENYDIALWLIYLVRNWAEE